MQTPSKLPPPLYTPTYSIPKQPHLSLPQYPAQNPTIYDSSTLLPPTYLDPNKILLTLPLPIEY